jgi:hypothetical protein
MSFTLAPLEIEQYKLENGLRVVLNRDPAVPVVAIAVYYDVGSRNEVIGRTGFAHLFEHMMFQGSENVKKAEHFQYIMKAGGTMNGTTSSERTNYFETLPANQLPLGLWLESDRMRSLAVTQENLDNQREAVKEEKRLRYDNQPYGQIFDMISEMIYKNFANAHSTIGSMEDLDAVTHRITLCLWFRAHLKQMRRRPSSKRISATSSISRCRPDLMFRNPKRWQTTIANGKTNSLRFRRFCLVGRSRNGVRLSSIPYISRAKCFTTARVRGFINAW